MAKRKQRRTAGDKTICLPIADNIDYATLADDRAVYRQYLDQQIAAHPELFPAEISQGYRFHGWTKSLRQDLKIRRIYVPSTHEAYQLRPDFNKIEKYWARLKHYLGKTIHQFDSLWDAVDDAFRKLS